ncbi:MAG: ABC transporter permease [Chloroflexi bacterium RBG_13_56_8]|nr:MAG: ABC transporter permease [Chloroflexi bacterium RBG_13_56_8]
MLKAQRAIFSAAFRTNLQYRVAALAGIGTQLFWGFIRVMIFEAFYRSTSTPQPISYPQVVTYVWLSQATLLLLPMRANPEIQAMIRSGTVAYELLRPVDLYALWYSRSLASRTAPVLLRAAPIFLVAGLFLGLQAPPSLASAAAWALSIVAAMLLSAAFTTLVTISLLWTVSGEGMSHLLIALSSILSGIIVPLPFFPDWTQAILNFLPFRGLMDIPFRLYVGYVSPSEVFSLVAHQLAWTLVLVFLGRWLLGRATRRLVVQGG